MAGKTLMSFLMAGLSKFGGLGDIYRLPSNWNFKYIYFPNKEEE